MPPSRRAPGRCRLPSQLTGGAPPSPLNATIRRSMSTKRPDNGRFDQVVSAVTWNSTMTPLPRWSAVTSGVPSLSCAQVFPGRPASGSARTWRDTVTSWLGSSPEKGLAWSNGARVSGLSQDRAPPKVRPPRRRSTGSRSSAGAPARREPAKRSSTPPSSTKRASRSCATPATCPTSASTSTDGFSSSAVTMGSPEPVRISRTSAKGASALTTK